jgi:hypothetical protein
VPPALYGATCIQVVLSLTAVQTQPLPAVTVILSLPPERSNVLSAGSMPYVHPTVVVVELLLVLVLVELLLVLVELLLVLVLVLLLEVLVLVELVLVLVVVVVVGAS